MTREPYYSDDSGAPPDRRAVHVVLDNVRSAFNVGSIFRTADAAGIGCIHLCGITCWPPHPKLEKTSLGAHQYVSWKRHESTETALHWLRDTMSGDENDQWRDRLVQLLSDPAQGAILRADLADGMASLPVWMQELLRPLVVRPESDE